MAPLTARHGTARRADVHDAGRVRRSSPRELDTQLRAVRARNRTRAPGPRHREAISGSTSKVRLMTAFNPARRWNAAAVVVAVLAGTPASAQTPAIKAGRVIAPGGR